MRWEGHFPGAATTGAATTDSIVAFASASSISAATKTKRLLVRSDPRHRCASPERTPTTVALVRTAVRLAEATGPAGWWHPIDLQRRSDHHLNEGS